MVRQPAEGQEGARAPVIIEAKDWGQEGGWQPGSNALVRCDVNGAIFLIPAGYVYGVWSFPYSDENGNHPGGRIYPPDLVAVLPDLTQVRPDDQARFRVLQMDRLRDAIEIAIIPALRQEVENFYERRNNFETGFDGNPVSLGSTFRQGLRLIF